MSTKKTIAKSFTVSTIEDGVSVQAQYAPNANPTSDQIHTVWQEGDLYMRTRESDESAWSSWHKIVGENGGETDYQFALSANLVTQDGTSDTAPSDIPPSAWQDAPLPTIPRLPFLWEKVQKKDGSGNNVGNPSYIRITGEEGKGYKATVYRDNFTLANWNTYGTIGHVESWGNTGSSRNGCGVGDLFLVVGKATDDSSYHKLTYRCDNSSGDLHGTCVEHQVTNDGKDGTSPYFADLNNEMDAIQCKHDGGVITAQTVYTVISMWKGSAVEAFVIDNIYRNGTKLTWDGNNNGVWPRLSGSTVSLEFTTSASIADIDDFKITIHSYNDNTVTRELHFTINGVRANAIYRLVLSHSQIVKKKDGTYVPSGNVTCSVEKTENGSTSTPSSSEYTLEKSVNGGSYTTYSATAASSITSDLKFRLKVGGVVVDLETIPLVSDGDPGDPGERGKVGRFFYYAGELNDFASTDSFLVNDAQAPYFHYDKNYWVFNPETNGTYTKQDMGTPSSSSSNWNLMTSDFKYIITEAIFGAYAHFGSFIINGDWLLSTNGKVGESVVSGESNISGSVIGGSSFSVKAVTLFDSAYPSDGMVDIAYENNIVTIGTSETTKQIMTVYLSSSLTYRVSCDYSRSSSGSFYVRIRNASYGSVVPIYLAGTSGSSSGNFRVTTSGTYIVEIYTTSAGYTASVWNTSVSRLLFAPMYAVDGKKGASFQGGNGVFRGFVRKQKTRITTSNIDKYKRTDITSATVLDFDKCGSFIELATGTYGYITLPLMSDYLASRYTSKQIDDIRSFVGTTMLIYNKSGRDIPMTLRYNSDGSTTSGTLHNGNCVELECCLDGDANDGKEIIYWKVISYAEPVV